MAGRQIREGELGAREAVVISQKHLGQAIYGVAWLTARSVWLAVFGEKVRTEKEPRTNLKDETLRRQEGTMVGDLSLQDRRVAGIRYYRSRNL